MPDFSNTSFSPEDALAALGWQIELGADEAIGEVPVNRYEEPAAKPTPKAEPKSEVMATVPVSKVDPVEISRSGAKAADSLEALAEIMAAYDHCELKLGAKNFVFADGNPKARVMIVGEAPGRDEDIQGKPFVGRAGKLLDKMFGAIDMGRAHPDALNALYIANILPWRPPQNRDPSPQEMAMMLPFVERHVELVDPDILVLMGNISCGALLGRRGITRLRGKWTEALGRPCLPMFHPAYLLRNPAAKREAWADLLDLKACLKGQA